MQHSKVIKALLLVILVSGINSSPVFSEPLDSLKAVLDTTKNVDRKAALAYRVAYQSMATDPEGALEHCTKAIKYYAATGNKEWEARSFHLQYTIALQIGNSKQAILSLFTANELYTAQEMLTEKAATTLDIARMATLHHDFENAYSYLIQAKKDIATHEDPWYQAQWHLRFGVWHKEQGHWAAAIPYLKKASELLAEFLEQKLKTDQHLITCYIKLKQFDEAEFALQANYSQISELKNQDYWKALHHNKLGLIALEQDEYNEALLQFNTAILRVRNTSDIRLRVVILNNTAGLYVNKKQWGNAHDHLLEAISLKDRVVDPLEVGYTYDLLIQYYENNNDFEKALAYSKEKTLTMMYASEYEELKQQNKDREAWDEAISEIEASNQAKQDAALAQAKMLAYGAILSLVLVVLLAFALFLLYRSRLQKRIIKALEATNDASQEKIRLLKKSNETDDWILKFIANRKR